MTIYFHTKHFQETNLELLEYMILLMYENDTLKIVEIEKSLRISQRTVIRLRNGLIKKGYLERIPNEKQNKYRLTNKMYQEIN